MEISSDQMQTLRDMDILSGLTLPDETADILLRPMIEADFVRQTHFVSKGLYTYELTEKGRRVISNM